MFGGGESLSGGPRIVCSVLGRVALVSLCACLLFVASACADGESARSDGSTGSPVASPNASPTFGPRAPVLDETECSYVWPSNAPSGCDTTEWCVPRLNATTACFQKGTHLEGARCTEYSDCAEGLFCSQLQCTRLCNDAAPCPENSACVDIHSDGRGPLFKLCRPVDPEPCCANGASSCTCYEPCPFTDVQSICDASSGCCFRGLEDNGVPTCVCFAELPDGYLDCADFVRRQGIARGVTLTQSPTCP